MGKSDPLVVLVSHNQPNRLANLYERRKPRFKHDVLLVCNNDKAILEHIDIPTLTVPNDLRTRDIGMHRAAMAYVMMGESEGIKTARGRPFYFYLNDDVCILKRRFFSRARDELRRGAEFVGVQWNLSTYVPKDDHDKLPEGSARHEPASFIRTHAFAATFRGFVRRWVHPLEPSAQAFEKGTAQIEPFAVLDDPTLAIDENTRPFLRWLELAAAV